MPRITRRRAVGICIVVVSACGFGSGALFAKPVYGAGLDWLTLLAWRFFFGAVASWLWLLAIPENRRALRSISRRRLVVLVLLGVLYVGNSATYYAALETVEASLAALIVYVYPALVAVLALRWGRRLRGRRPWVALALAMGGVVLALGTIGAGHVPPISGLALALASPLIYAVWIILSARLAGERREPRETPPPEAIEPIERTDPAPAAAVMLTATFLVFLALAGLTGRPITPGRIPLAAWPGLLGVGLISTALAMQAFYAGTRRIGAAQAALVSTVEPIWTIGLATTLFGETLTPPQVLGGICVIVGVLVAQSAPDAAAPRGVSGAEAGQESTPLVA